MSKIKRVDIREFCEKGFLQEANRLFFHPLGLALEVDTKEDEWKLSGVWDYRDDPDGMLYEENIGSEKDAQKKARYVSALKESKIGARDKFPDVKNGIQLMGENNE